MSTGPLTPERQMYFDALKTVHNGRNLAHLFLLASVTVGSAGEISSTEATEFLNDTVYSDAPERQVSRGYSHMLLSRSIPESVAEPTAPVVKGNTTTYAMTDFAAQIVLPTAALVTDLCFGDPSGRLSPLGLVSSPKPDHGSHHSAFDTRRRIYATLARNPADTLEITAIDASIDDVNPKVVYNHLEQMRKHRLIEFVTGSQRSCLPDFTKNPDFPGTRQELYSIIDAENWSKAKKRLGRRFIQAVEAEECGDTISISGFLQLLEETPEVTRHYTPRSKEEYQTKALRRKTLQIIDALANLGYLKPVEEPGTVTDHVKILDKSVIGRYLRETVQIIALGDSEVRSHYVQLGQEIANSPEMIAWIADSDFSRGALIRRKTAAEHASTVARLLAEHGGLTTTELASMLGMDGRAASNLVTRLRNNTVLPIKTVAKGRSVVLQLASE